MVTTLIAMRALSRASITFPQTFRCNTSVLTLASTKPHTTATSAHNKPAIERSTIDNLNEDAGNYLTGPSTLGDGDAFSLFVGGIGAVWIAGQISDEVKDVVWPKVR